MKVTAERIDNHKMVLEMEVPQVEVKKAFDRAYQNLANKVNIPGFRKGKTPRKVLEMRIGKEAFADEAFELLAPAAYGKALEEQDVEPVSRPQIDVVILEEDKPFVFKATVITKPEISIGQYKDLKVEHKPAEIGETEINKALEDLREKNAKMSVVENAVLQKGDFAIIDFAGYIDGQPFKGGDAKGYPLEVGSGSFIPGFEDQLIGAKTEENREVTVTFPADYFVAELAGKEAKFTVTVHDIKRKELPVLDDEFAKDAGEFNSLEELKADIKNKLEKAAAERSEKEFRNQAIKQAVDNATVDIPDVMIEDKIDQMIQDFDINLQNRGMALDQYLKYLNMDIAGLREKYRESAAVSVKTDLLLDAVVKAEEIKAETKDLEDEVAAMAAEYHAPLEDVRKVILEQNRVGALALSVARKKAAKLIIDSAVKQ
ncbi:trigger factor [Acetonema longum]|uniref:Trigger factor n=1 Tax=Acetonema longum DSM 6540 TaxID=1009370 RepID=F7NHK3_9FIRM|nr:trigger factor [Acetonema longum]EGO64378.1 trigger factor [Acetonema longum DSM 6540]